MEPDSYEYKAGVKEKVKEIESKLAGNTNDQEKSSSQDVPNKFTVDQNFQESFNPNGPSSAKLANNSNRLEVILNVNTISTARRSLVKRPAVIDQGLLTQQLSKQEKPQIIRNREPENEKVANRKQDNSFSTQQQPVLPPVPAPHTKQPSPRPANFRNNEKLETSPLEPDSSLSTRRSSSEDDGIADMASESDPFDDSNMPLPKIKENAFFLKDRKKSKEEEEKGGGFNVIGLPPLSPRRASYNPQSSFEEKSEKERPKSLRGRTDSTNSAENYVVRQISTDDSGSRRESQAKVKIDVLQSTGPTQIDSPVGSPVVVRSKTLSNSTASILVLGLPQSGKSATISSLVQAPITEKDGSPITASSLDSTEIVECTAKIKILDSSNLFNLRIIEAPGYTNDPTLVSDSRIMSTLVNHLESKDGLRGKPPTIVLVVLRFDDKRLWNPEDEHPDIVNFLKLLHNFQHHLNDGKFANFIFVLTHFLSGSSSENERKRPQSKIVELINLIQKYTSLPHPIMVICAENGPTKVQEKVPSKPKAVTLTNQETYPFNLIDKIKILLTKKGRDSVGETVLRTAFGIEYPYSIKECTVTKRIPLVPPSHSSIETMKKAILHAYLEIQRTEIFTLLEIGWENIDIKIREKFPESLFTVQQIFQTKKVCNFSDIPEDPAKILTLVRQMPSNLAVKDLLIDTLQLKVPACYPALYIGQGFDLGKDTTTNVSPFLLTSGFKTSPVGLIPNEFECRIRDDREICFKFFHSVEDYVTQRLKDLNLLYSISPNSLTALSNSFSNSKIAHQRWGYNLIKGNQDVTKSTVATAVIEYRVFQLSINPLTELNFKPQFWETVKDLPDLDIKNAASVSAWKDFFDYWGTHVVKSAFGGGSVEITFRGNVLSNIYNSMKKDLIMPTDEYETTKVFQWITGDGLDFVAACGRDVKNDFLHDYDVAAHFHGGDIKYQQIDLSKLGSKEELTDVREEWKESLVLNPVMLESNLVLVPLSYFVRQKSEGIATKIDVALHYFYSDFMMSQGKQSSCTIL